MLQIPRLDEMMRVTDNSNKLAAAGFSFNEIQDLKKQEVLNSMNAPRPLGGSFGGAGLAGGFDTQPRRYAEGGTIEMARPGMGIARSQFLKQPTPPGIAAANPGAYYSPKRKSVVIGDPKGNTEKAVGGFTWSGPAIKDGQFFANTGATSFEMPKPGERRGPIGGRATPPAPDRFGHQFWKPTSPAPEGTTTSGGVSRAPMPWELPGYSGGGTIIGPGGPKDDMIPAMVDGIKPIAVSNGEEIVDAETRDYFGRKFFIDLKKKAEKGMEEAKGHTEMGHGEKPGFNIGGTIPAPTLAAMTESAANARLDRGLSPEPYGPTMNDHPAFQPVPAAPPVAPAPSAMITPVMEPQPMTAQFAPRTVGEPAAPPRPSNVPFLAPWEKDAARAAAADAASGRPAGVRKSDWRKMQSDPKFILGQQMRMDRMAEAARQEQIRREDQAVAMNKELFRTNTRIQLDAMNRAAGLKDAADARAVEENYRIARENRDIGVKAAMNAADRAEQTKLAKDFTDVPGSDYVINALGNLIRKADGKPVGLAPEDADKYGLEISGADSEGRVRYKPKAQAKALPVRQVQDSTTGKWLNFYEDGTYDEAKPRGQGASTSSAPPQDRLKSALERLNK